MRWRQPSRTLARFWLSRFNEAMAALADSGFADDDAKAAVSALRALLEREPECAELVVGLVVSLVVQAENSLSPPRVLEAVDLGLQAERVRADLDPERPLQRALLTIVSARIHLGKNQPFRALEHAVEAGRVLQTVADRDAQLAGYLRAEAHQAEAEAWDALLEPARALDHYDAAYGLVRPFIDDPERWPPLFDELIPFLYGDPGQLPEEVVSATLQAAWYNLATAHVTSAVGIARCQAMLGSPAAARAARDAAEAVRKVGPGPTDPLRLVPAVRHGDADVARDLLDAVVSEASALDLDAYAYRSVLGAAAAAGIAEAGGDPAELLAEAQAARERLGDALYAAASLGLALVADRKRGTPTDTQERAFLEALQRLEDAGDPRLRDLRVRAAFDEPLAQTIDRVASAYAARAGVDRRIQLARLLDSLSERRPAFDALLGEAAAIGSIDGGREALDRLGRLEAALRSWPEAGAIVERELEAETLFVCASGDAPAFVVRAGPSYRAAARTLGAKLAEELDALELVGTLAPAEVFEGAGRAAFAALPARVREFVAVHPVILLCPDYRTGGDAIPYELFHDGSGWLGLKRVIARHPTLGALTRSVEGTARRDPHLRALAVAVPRAEGFEELRFAVDEAAWVRQRLAEADWDAPEIEPTRVSAAFLLDRLPFAAHLHIAAHGEASGHDEALVITGGERLRTDDLLGRFFPRLPTVYLNTCSLASSRYVGAGISRGVALALAESGAAAVLANLLPVDDAVSSEIARAFYESDAGFGEALRAARLMVASNGASPLLWGTTVLIGDPRTTLRPSRPSLPLAERLLDAHFALLEKADAATIEAAQRALAAGESDPRLIAAAELGRATDTWGGEPTVATRGKMCTGLRLALELDHLPAAAMISVLIAETVSDADEPDLALRIIEESLLLVEPLEHESRLWKRILDGLLVRWIQLRRGERFEPRVLGAEDDDARHEVPEFARAVIDSQLAVEARAVRRGDAPRPREEREVADVCWNAILGGRELNLDDMPEIFAYCSQVAQRVARLGGLPEATLTMTATAIAGLLPWLWDSQHVTDLPREMAEGQAGTLGVLVASLGRYWPPAPASWFQTVQSFSDTMGTALASLEGLPYSGELDRRIDEVITEIGERARALLVGVDQQNPDRLPDAAAWILGTLVKRNTYSWADGSVPEEICQRLKDVYAEIAADGEGLFMPWLIEGFRGVREGRFDELDRWKYGISEQTEHEDQVEDGSEPDDE